MIKKYVPVPFYVEGVIWEGTNLNEVKLFLRENYINNEQVSDSNNLIWIKSGIDYKCAKIGDMIYKDQNGRILVQTTSTFFRNYALCDSLEVAQIMSKLNERLKLV